jgi:hypothetical protein
LVSDSPTPLDFVIAVHSLSGRAILAPSMTIQPEQKLPVDIGALLTQLGGDVTGDFGEGSLAIYFTGTVMPLAGQITMENPARSLISQVEMVDNSPGVNLLPKQLSGVWWGLGTGRDARIMVNNTSAGAVTADVFLDFMGQRHTSAPLIFDPHETKVLSITSLLGELKVSPAQAPEGGISIVARGATHPLIAQGRITDAARGFSTTLNFPDPTLQTTNALHASGVPIGAPTADSPFANAGTFVPHVILRNLMGSPQTVTISIEYPTPDGPAQTTLALLPLGGYRTQDVPLDSAFASLPLPIPYCSIRIQYSGTPGSAMAEVTSVEQEGNLVIDSRVANEGDGWAGSGAHPWHLDDETESTLFLTDMGDRPARIGFLVQAGGVLYSVSDLKLTAHETRAIDLRKLRDAQKPDWQGHRIPAGATDGSVLWIRLDNVPVMGRLVVLQRHTGMASNYNCPACDCPASYSNLAVTPTPVSLYVGGTSQEYAIAYYVDCNGNPAYNNYVLASWSVCPACNPSVATVGSTGLVTAEAGGSTTILGCYTDNCWTYCGYPGPTCTSHSMSCCGPAAVSVQPKITGISPSLGLIGANTSVTISGSGFGQSQGSSTVNAGSNISFSYSSWSDTQIGVTFQVGSNAPSGNHSVTVTTAVATSNSVNFYVQVPAGLTVASTISSQPNSSCPSGQKGWDRWLWWQVLDQGRNPISAANMYFYDTISAQATSGCNVKGNTNGCWLTSFWTGSGYTNSQGQFKDHYFFCSSCCSCTTSASQTYYVNNNPIAETISYTCSGITINGQ